MPYAKDYKKSRLMDDEQLMLIVEKVFDTGPEQGTIIKFDDNTTMLSTERKIRAVLRGLGRTKEFRISRTNEPSLIITVTTPTSGIKSITEESV